MMYAKASQQTMFHNEANIRPTSLTSFVEGLSEMSLLRKVNACMGPNSCQSRIIRIIKPGFVSLPTGKKPRRHVPLHLNIAVKISLCMYASLHIVCEELQGHERTATMSDDGLT